MKRSKATLIIIGFFLLSILTIFLFDRLINGAPNYISTCADAKERHLTNIPEGSVYYRVELDRDNDGVACES